jgi:hypothetical protein
VAEIRYKIRVNHELRDFWGYDTTVDVGCGKTFFDRLPVRSPQENNYDSVDTFILPIDPHNTGMEIGSFFVERDPGVYLFSHPSYDDLCGAKIYLNMPYEDWGNYTDSYSLRCGQGLTSSSGDDADGFANFTVRGFRAASPSP